MKDPEAGPQQWKEYNITKKIHVNWRMTGSRRGNTSAGEASKMNTKYRRGGHANGTYL